MSDIKQKWEEVLKDLHLSLSSATFKTWFRNVHINEITDDKILLDCQNPFTKEWLEQRYQAELEESLFKKCGVRMRLEFRVVAQNTPPAENTGPLFKSVATSPLPTSNDSNLNPYYSFENFIVGPSNNLAHAAALAVAETPGKAYNPFFLYGGVGIGKTHLMHAIGNTILLKKKKARVLYVSSENFTNDLIDSFRKNQTDLFRKRYRQVDVLIIDDIQFISGKETIQEEFFHTFNALYSLSKQIIVSSDRPPQELQKLENRLRSRFEGGLIIDIQQPDFETRMAILLAKCEERRLNVPPEVLNYIAENVVENVRQLEGALTQIVTIARFSNSAPTLEIAAQTINRGQPKHQKQITPKVVLEKCAAYYRISLQEIKGKSRRAEIVFPRQIIMYYLRKEMNVQLEHIGDLLGSRDHSTVMHGIEKIETLVNIKNARALKEIKEVWSFIQQE